MRYLRTALTVAALGLAQDAWAQTPYTLASPVNHLATIFTDLYGEGA